MAADSTAEPSNGVVPHGWQCYDGVTQQQWIAHSNGLIELGCSGYCLDLKDGYNGRDSNKDIVVQLWDCTPGNKNQEWDVLPPPWQTA